jgi:hypothetical protein
MKFTSRKFILTVVIITLTALLPMAYKWLGVGEAVTMTVLGIMAGVGAAYGFVNVKAKGKEKDESE